MFISKMHLSRRAVLRGVGATIALPFLDAMVPALTAQARTAANPVRRFGTVFVGLGERPSPAPLLSQQDPDVAWPANVGLPRYVVRCMDRHPRKACGSVVDRRLRWR